MKGSITKRGKRRYLIRIFLGRDPVTGKEARPGRTIHGTRKEAESILRNWIIEYESGQYIRDQRQSLNEYLEEWKELKLKERVKPKTFHAYSYDLDRFVTNTIGKMPLGKLRRQDIQNLYVRLVGRGTGPTSVKRLHACLSKALGDAVKTNRIAVSPTDHVEIPGINTKVKRRPPKPMSSRQASAFLEAASNTPWLSVFEVALSTGMRPGEYLGLSWDCVDFTRNRIRVVRTAVFLPGKTELGTTKTKKSKRSISVNPSIMKSLQAHREEQESEKLNSEYWRDDLNLVFPGRKGEIWNKDTFRSAFIHVQDLAGLSGFSPYSLRHTFATLLLKADVHPKIVSEMLGHSTISQTLDTYSHVIRGMDDAASSKINELLNVNRQFVPDWNDSGSQEEN